MCRVLICGSRDWVDTGYQIFRFINRLPEDCVVIHGGARGVDSMAGEIATFLGLSVMEFPADWKRYGRAAGIIRNQQMLDEGRPNTVVYFHEDLANSRGTKDMVTRAQRAGLPIIGNPNCHMD